MEGRVVDVGSVIDESRIGRFHVAMLALGVAVMMCDGFDTQAVAYVAPSLAADWRLAPGTFGPVFSAALLGAMVGAFALGYIADRVGRKPTLVASILLFGVLNLASASTTTIDRFTLLRFACGIGLGGAIPNIMALVSEYAPAGRRASFVAIAWCGFAVGAVVGGLASVALILRFGWMSVFVLGGIVPLALAPFVVAFVPESLMFLLRRARLDRRTIAAILVRVDPTRETDDGDFYVSRVAKPARGPLVALFRDGNATGSILLCGAFAMSLLLVYCLINWIPLLLRQMGLPLSYALLGTVVFNLAGIFGSLFCSWLIDRDQARSIVILVAAYFLGAVAVMAIGLAGANAALIMATIFLSGFLIIGVQISLNAFITNYYPPAIRATGIGWSQLVGRTGSLVGPYLAGLLVAGGVPPDRLFEISALAPLLACLFLIAFWLLSAGTRHMRTA
jgi:AAHS family 4-hydroxybenzoate transporter-like MFS transporter